MFKAFNTIIAFFVFSACSSEIPMKYFEIERASVNVVDDKSMFVPAVKVSNGSSIEFITTEEFAKGRTLENVTVYPTDSFDVMKPETVADFLGGNIRIITQANNIDPGPDLIFGTGDDFETGSIW